MQRHVRIASTEGIGRGRHVLADEFNLPENCVEIQVHIDRDTRANSHLGRWKDSGQVDVVLLRSKDGKNWTADGGAFVAFGGVHTDIDFNGDEYDAPVTSGRFGVKEDGYVYKLQIDSPAAQKLDIEVNYITLPGKRQAPDKHNSVGIVDADYASGTVTSSVTIPSLDVSGSNRGATVIVNYENAASRVFTSCKWGGSGGTDATSVLYTINNTYSMQAKGYWFNNSILSSAGTVYVLMNGNCTYLWASACSWNNVDQSTPTHATWTAAAYGTPQTETVSTSITTANGSRIHLQGSGYCSYGTPSHNITGSNATNIITWTGQSGGRAAYYSPTTTPHAIGYQIASTYTYDYPHLIASAISLKEASAGTPTDITVNNMAVGTTLGQPSITQTHQIATANMAVATTLSQPSVDSSDAIDPDDMAVATTLSQPQIDHIHHITTDNLSVATTLSQPAITQVHEVSPNDLAVSTTLSAPAVTAGGDPPAGDIDFKVACGYAKLALKDMEYDGGDADSTGFKPQYSYAINGGSFSDWIDVELGSQSGFNYDWYLEAKWPYEFDDDGDDFTPGDYVSVKMRTVNSYGSGSESATKIYRVHSSWHRTGVRRYNPSAAVGHAAAGYDVTPEDHHEGPVTTGGLNRLLLLAFDMAYGDNLSGNIVPHTAQFNGDLMTKLLSYENNAREEPGPGQTGGGNGGCEVHYLVNPDTGQHTLELDWDDPTTQKSLWLTAAAFQNVDQSLPISGWRIRLSPGPPVFDGIGNIPLDPTLDVFNPPEEAERKDYHLPRAVASMDELIIGFQGAYGSDLSGGVNSNTFGEAGATGANWGSHTGSSASLTDGIPYDTNLVIFAGCGMGNEDESRLAAYLPGTLPTEMPVFTLHWERAEVSYLTLIQFGIRPTPDMIHTLQVNAATTGAIDFQFGIYCNHGDILLAVTSQTDPEPTSVQIQDELDSLGSSDYEDTIHILDTHTMTNGEVSASAGGTVTDSLAGLPAGNYRLTAVYQQQQGFKGGTGELGTQISVNFTVTVSEIAPNNMAVGTTLTQPAITQVHAITPNALTVPMTLSQPTISEIHAIAPNNLSVGATLSQPAITQVHVIDPDDMSVITTLSVPTITQLHVIQPNDMAVGVSMEGTFIDFGTEPITDLAVYGIPGPYQEIGGKQHLYIDFRMFYQTIAQVNADKELPHSITITSFYRDVPLTYYNSGQVQTDITLPNLTLAGVVADKNLPVLSVLTVDSDAIFRASWRGWMSKDAKLYLYWSGVQQTTFIQGNDEVFFVDRAAREFLVNKAENEFVLDRVRRTFNADD